jgi:hypothetical protein
MGAVISTLKLALSILLAIPVIAICIILVIPSFAITTVRIIIGLFCCCFCPTPLAEIIDILLKEAEKCSMIPLNFLNTKCNEWKEKREARKTLETQLRADRESSAALESENLDGSAQDNMAALESRQARGNTEADDLPPPPYSSLFQQ